MECDSELTPFKLQAFLYKDNIEWPQNSDSIKLFRGNWRSSIEYAYEKKNDIFYLYNPNGTISSYYKIDTSFIKKLELTTTKADVFYNFEDGAFIEEENEGFTIIDRSKTKMVFYKNGRLHKVMYSNNTNIIFIYEKNKILISVNGRTVLLSLLDDKLRNVEFILENVNCWHLFGLDIYLNKKIDRARLYLLKIKYEEILSLREFYLKEMGRCLFRSNLF